MAKRFVLLLFSCCILLSQAKGQKQQADSINRDLLKKIIIFEAAGYSILMSGLGTIWYQEGFDGQFKFFNDNQQWRGLDKIGHSFTAYQLTSLNAGLLKKTNISQKDAFLYAALISSSMMLGIEVLDGFSKDYGASWGDLTANIIGAFLPFQEMLWETNYIHPKFSFHPSPYAAIRPNVLGENLSEQWLKDYNGQTYWLSTNFNIFSPTDRFPEWLAFSVGYGAEGMVYGSIDENRNNGYDAYRRLYLSLDLDLSKINSDKKWLRAVLYGLNMLKVPFPTLSISTEGVKFHPLYF